MSYRFHTFSFAILLASSLSGCYMVNQQAYTNYVNERVKPEMTLVQAVDILSSDGFNCDSHSSAPATTCTRNRQSLLPYTCVERVNLTQKGQSAVVKEVEIPPIVCGGL